MRIAVAGVGRIGVMHARNLAATPGVSEVVVQDPAPGRAAEVAALLTGAVPVTAAPDLATALKGADGLLVAVPTPAHAEAVYTALDAGVPVLVEKPVAADLATIREVIRAVERTEVPVLVGFQRRFDPAIAELKARITRGALGDLYVVRATAFDAEPPVRSTSRRPAASSATCSSTTWTACPGWSDATWSRCTPPGRCWSTRHSPRRTMSTRCRSRCVSRAE